MNEDAVKPADALPGKRPGTDGDVPSGKLAAVAGALVALLAASSLVAWLLFGVLRGRRIAEDPPPSPLLEARKASLPPEPRLQPDPIADMAALRARQEAALNGYGWVDRRAGVVRIPIERAMELAAVSGLRPVLRAAAPSDAAPGEVAPGDAAPGEVAPGDAAPSDAAPDGGAP